MENTNTPNTPAELFAMQLPAEEPKCNHGEEDCNSFADFLMEDLIPDLEPTPYQTVKAIERMLGRLKAYHFEILHDGEGNMDEWVRTMWQEDYERLSKALDCVRLINPD